MFNDPLPMPSGLTRPPIQRTASGLALTDREMQVLIGLSHGHSNVSMAELMFLSAQTIKTHVHGILRKLGAVDRAHAVRLGLELGVLIAAPGSPARAALPRHPVPPPGLRRPTRRDPTFRDVHIGACLASEACPCRYHQRPMPPSHEPRRSTRTEIPA